MLNNDLVGRRRAVRAANRTFHRLRHPPVDRFHVKGEFLAATTLDFYSNHNFGFLVELLFAQSESMISFTFLS